MLFITRKILLILFILIGGFVLTGCGPSQSNGYGNQVQASSQKSNQNTQIDTNTKAS